MKNKRAVNTPADSATIFFDVTDLMLHLLHHTTLSGIQRVQCEILCNLLDIPHPQPFRFVVLNELGSLGAIEISALLRIVEDSRSNTTSRAGIESGIRALFTRAVPCMVLPRDIFLTLGAFWNVRGMGGLLQQLKNSGAIIGVFIHDIIPIVAPEYFEARDTRSFVKGVVEALTFADFILTTSEFNKASLAGHMACRKLDPLPIHVIPLGHELSLSAPVEAKISSVVADILETGYVLCVGTIEVRKNPGYLFNIWKMMVRSGRSNIPYLVFVGRKGWLVQDFMDQLKGCDFLGGRILVVHNVTDVELDLLYRKCVLTMLASFIEGWGLPVGESLCHGKICLCSATGGIPEVGGELLDYIDPYNASGGLAQLLRYVDNPELRHSREREIAGRFAPRSWRAMADDFLRSTQELADQVRPFEGVAAIRLPPGRYMPITGDAAATSLDAMDGRLSAALICISGWRVPETAGARAAQPETIVRFRPDAAVGTRINVTLRLAAHGRDFRIRIRSGSGAESEASLAAGSRRIGVLSAEVEPGQLVTISMSLVGATPGGNELSGAANWILEGILYFDPKRVAGEPLANLNGGHRDRSRATAPPLPVKQPSPPKYPSGRDPILVRPAAMEDTRPAASFGAFLQTTDCYWSSGFTSDRDAPIFADQADRRAFYTGCGNSAEAPRVGRIEDSIRLVRRSDQFVSMSRFSEGSVFDRSGVSRALGYLQNSPADVAPWLLNEANGVRIEEESLDAAPYYDHSCLIFYNGNLHNYYHWVVEGLLGLDILSRALGPDSNLKIVLPKSMDICALFDHRDTLRAVGLDRREIVEFSASPIRVREAIWLDSDLVQSMPAPYLKDFQRRVAAQYAGLCSRKRRLLVARKGPTRKIHNIDEVQAFLQRYDFETVFLEGMSAVDQILLFQSAEFIIGPHGAGLANLLFCEPGTKVIELAPSVEIRPFFWLISEKLDLVHALQFCPVAAEGGFQSSIIVDVNKLQALIGMVEAHL